jgi:hypothetical protein
VDEAGARALFYSTSDRYSVSDGTVPLLSRRNEGLETILKDFVEGLRVRKENANANANGKRKVRD